MGTLIVYRPSFKPECSSSPLDLAYHSHWENFEEDPMPDDQTLATILAICDLIKRNGTGVKVALESYEQAMKEEIEYRRSQGLTEVGGLPAAK